MEDIRCTNCSHLIGKKVQLRYGEFKCSSCGAINIIDRSSEGILDKADTISNNDLTA